jgi:A/G-specific adenine glycosylase
MDLGQLVCTARAPACLLCPWSRACRGRKLGLLETLPLRNARTPRRKLTILAALLVGKDGSRLLARRRERGLFGGLWELPGGEIDGDSRAAERLRELLRENLGLDTTIGEQLGSVTRTLTHRDLQLVAYRAAPVRRAALSPAGPYLEARFFKPHEVEKLGLSSATRKLLEILD